MKRPRVSYRIRQLRDALVSVWALIVTGGPFIVLAVAALVAAYWIVDPSPPRKLVMATGPEASDYERFGERYKQILARHGIQVELRNTEGSRDNLRALRDEKSDVQVAFVRSAAAPRREAATEGLVSIGSLFYEPVWLFYREKVKIRSLSDLRGKSVNVGPMGSGTARLADALLAQNGVDPADLRISQSDHSTAVAALLDGELDALVFTSASDGLLIQMLLRTPGIRLFDFVQAEAYARRLPSLSHVVMPRGIVDLARDTPPRNVSLIAPTSTLVAREGTHSALLNLLVQAAAEIHGAPDWFARPREFPSPRSVDFPLAEEARRYYQSGPPFLQRYLPFWLANLFDRMWVVVLSLLALLIPLSRLLPPLYQWRIRSRVYKWYGRLRALEYEVKNPDPDRGPADVAALSARLDEIEEKVNDISVPLSHADEVYFLRQHIELVRSRLRAGTAGEPGETTEPAPGGGPALAGSPHAH